MSLSMLRSTQASVPAAALPALDAAAADPLLCVAGPIVGCHALVLGPNGLDMLCRLLRHGCAAATSLCLAERPQHDAFDLVVAPCVEAAQAGRVANLAWRASMPAGRFVALATVEAAGLLANALRLAGFAAVCLQPTPAGIIVRAERPAGWRLA